MYTCMEIDVFIGILLRNAYMYMHTLTHAHSCTADPYVAAMEFLQVNGLPDMYLDQVAEFIIQNAGEYQGPIDSAPADPLTGS